MDEIGPITELGELVQQLNIKGDIMQEVEEENLNNEDAKQFIIKKYLESTKDPSIVEVTKVVNDISSNSILIKTVF